eukprot:TRINITY_DN369_c0_g2_i1.p1 TRINITY_DN369_c0_g2~~TRINITY_DN369_c0_g2_i1.p1  ORF type:complete len:215 (+),score=-53.73 TRINITY_DN369_c0_g2_i1:129-773(+)
MAASKPTSRLFQTADTVSCFTQPVFRDLNPRLDSFPYGPQAYPRGPQSQRLRRSQVRSSTKGRPVSRPKPLIGRSTPQSISAEVLLRQVSRGTSYFQFRLAFHPYTQVIGKICTSLPVRSSTPLSRGFNLPTHRSTGFGYPTSDSRRAHLAPRTLRCCVLVGFPVTPAFNALVSPLIRTRWPVIQNGQHNAAPLFRASSLQRHVWLQSDGFRLF